MSLVQFLESRKGCLIPEVGDIFNAYKLVQPSQLRVLIIGQSPLNRFSNGLAYSDSSGITSGLKTIFRELQRTGYGERTNSDLTDWARQGVMLLNEVLTIETDDQVKHSNKGWEYLFAQTLRRIDQLPQRIVVMSWGSAARSSVMKYTRSSADHLVLHACHPVAEEFTGGRVRFSGCNHFVLANQHLGARSVNWNP